MSLISACARTHCKLGKVTFRHGASFPIGGKGGGQYPLEAALQSGSDIINVK